jgi:hypothetical protein
MFIAIYRWKVEEGQEELFQAAWLNLTKAIYKKRGSLGSRLHKTEDGAWLAYAQWPDKETYEKASTLGSADLESGALLKESIVESQPTISLQAVADFLQISPSQD